MLKVSVSGIRGIWGKTLTIESITRYSQSFAKLVGESKTIILATDTRSTQLAFKNLVIGTLLNYGYTIIDLNITPTPLVSFAIRHLKADAGIILTASHNPVQWNAFKFMDQHGLFFDSEKMNKISEYFNAQDFLSYDHLNLGQVQIYKNIIKDYLDFVKPFFNVSLICQQNFRVVADLVNGAVSPFISDLSEALNLNMKTIFTDTSKDFERNPEPKPSSLEALKKSVLEHKAVIGLAFDPDGDRLAITDHKGNPLGEYWTLALAYLCFLEIKNPLNPNIVINLSTSILFEKIAKRFEAEVVRTAIGEINVTQALLKHKISIGGEGNGGVIFPSLNPCRDSFIAVFFILEYLSVKKTSLQEIVQEFEIPFIVNTSIEFKTPLNIDTLKKDLTGFLNSLGYKDLDFNTLDGLWIKYPQGFIHVRASNTENIIRLIGESHDEKNQEKIIDFCLQKIG